jgi:uncharacterized protein
VTRKNNPPVKCPICKKPVQAEAADFPFCSERCRSIDLGNWATGAYVVTVPVDDPDELLEQPPEEDEDSENNEDE